MVLPTEVYFVTALFLAAVLAAFLSFILLTRLFLFFKTVPFSHSLLISHPSVESHRLSEGASEAPAGSYKEVDKLNQLVQELEQARKELENQKDLLEEALLMVEKDNYRKTEELLEAQELQLSMLPQHTPFYPGYEIALFSQPAFEVGGDYYDYQFTANNKILNLVLGDATGHGLKPAILVATAKSYFQTLSGRSRGEEVLKHLSEAIQSLNVKSFYMGISLLEMDGDLLSLLSTGMPPAYFFDFKKQELSCHLLKGMFLGVRNVSEGQKKVIRMHRGDVLLLMTDGLAEYLNKEGELLGYNAVAKEFERQAHKSTGEIIHSLLDLGKNWAAGRPQQDDISLIIIKRK